MCLENYPGNRFYGTVTTSLRDQAASCPLLIPFLKSLTAALVGAQGHGPGLENWGPETGKADPGPTFPSAANSGHVLISSNTSSNEGFGHHKSVAMCS